MLSTGTLHVHLLEFLFENIWDRIKLMCFVFVCVALGAGLIHPYEGLKVKIQIHSFHTANSKASLNVFCFISSLWSLEFSVHFIDSYICFYLFPRVPEKKSILISFAFCR